MPPARSGIADYSAALLEQLGSLAEVTVFEQAAKDSDPSKFDIALYQIGNNADHVFAYEMALRRPGVVVIHEANLHHLIADLTIRRGDWDAYVRECEFDGGSNARDFAELRVRTLETGPDYDGVPMLRRIVLSARGVITHSDFVAGKVREAGFNGPLAIIPHGAWVGVSAETLDPAISRHAVRANLGLDDTAPLIGVFGYLKPYKRIAQTLRAFRRLARIDPKVRMILAGESHPEFPVRSLIQTLKLETQVRLLGYTPVEAFSAYINACDIVVNLRYPTVGESSGSLLRAFSVGRPALVSDVGSFAELPDDICLRVPVGPEEEEIIFEFLTLLVAQPGLGREIGNRAKAWVERECSWNQVAARYTAFLGAVAEGSGWTTESRQEPASEAAACEKPPDSDPLPSIANDTAGEENVPEFAGDSVLDLRDALPRIQDTESYEAILCADPAQLQEAGRLLKHGGRVALEAPNAVSFHSLALMLEGRAPSGNGERYTPSQIRDLLVQNGFEIVRLESMPRGGASTSHLWVRSLLEQCEMPTDLRGELIRAIGRKP